jgi:uncharacterized coiled-coil DUF342 family protein
MFVRKKDIEMIHNDSVFVNEQIQSLKELVVEVSKKVESLEKEIKSLKKQQQKTVTLDDEAQYEKELAFELMKK